MYKGIHGYVLSTNVNLSDKIKNITRAGVALVV